MKLSACLIVRDEERFLDRCLASLRGTVDEICVLDTGSRDRTREIARAHGAVLGSFEWNDDFAAARNACLDMASGDWILQVDADEELVAPRRAELERILNGRAACHLVELELRGDRASERTWQPRIFRRDPRLRYRRALHETILDALAEHHLPPPGKCDLLLVHHGYVGDVVASRDKIERNRRILRKVRDRGVADAYDCFKLAAALDAGPEPAPAAERTAAWTSCLSSGWATSPRIRAEWPWWARACMAAATHLWSVGALQESRSQLDRLLVERPDDGIRLARAHLDLASGHYKEGFERTRSLGQGVRVHALCREALEGPAGALDGLPAAPPLPALRARLLVALGRASEAVKLLETSFDSLLGDAEAGLDGAVAMFLLGESAMARNILSRSVPGSAMILLERAAWMDRLSGARRNRHPRDVLEAAEDVLDGVLRERSPEAFDGGFHLPAVRIALAGILERILSSGDEATIRRFASGCHTWEPVLPGVSRLVEGA